MNRKSLTNTARTLVAGDKGLLAMDESTPTCNKRFAALGIPQNEETRRAYRELIVTTPGLGESISGAILYDETIRQQKKDGTPFIKVLTDAGIIPGIKVDTGAKELALPHFRGVPSRDLDGNKDFSVVGLCMSSKPTPIVSRRALEDQPANLIYRLESVRGGTHLAAIALSVILFTAPFGHAAEPPDCHPGSYRLNDGSLVDIAPSDDGALRWRRFDGTTGALQQKAKGEDWTSTYGWTDRADGKTVSFSDCKSGEIQFDGTPGSRIAFDVTDTTFRSHDTTLTGRLVLPTGKSRVPVVILLHGSESGSALINYYLQRMLPAQGVGVFVYDKRGTGKSEGTYSQDFSLLADDAVAAMRQARHLAGSRAGRVGYQAGSQGGWVAPIAANRAPVDFVIVCFGLAVSVIDEDQQQVEIEMRKKGHTPDEIADALKVARAAGTVIASRFTEGFKEFDALREKYKNAAWYKDLHGNFTYMLLPHSEQELRAGGPKFDRGTPFHYDPMPALRAATTPQLWILGGEDYEAPSAETGRRIKSLIADDRPFTLAVYPGAEHGLTLFETTADGARLSTGYAPGYFAMIRDFAEKGQLHGKYGNAEITERRGQR